MKFSKDEIEAILKKHVVETFNLIESDIGKVVVFEVETIASMPPVLRSASVFVTTEEGVPKGLGPYRSPPR